MYLHCLQCEAMQSCYWHKCACVHAHRSPPTPWAAECSERKEIFSVLLPSLDHISSETPRAHERQMWLWDSVVKGFCFLFSLQMTFTCTAAPQKRATCKLVAVFIKNCRKCPCFTVCKGPLQSSESTLSTNARLGVALNCFYSHF